MSLTEFSPDVACDRDWLDVERRGLGVLHGAGWGVVAGPMRQACGDGRGYCEGSNHEILRRYGDACTDVQLDRVDRYIGGEVRGRHEARRVYWLY